MSVPYTFAAATGSIPLSQLDANFAYYDAAFTLTGTAVTMSGALTLSGGTANGVAYLNGSKVLTTGSVLTFDGQTLTNTRDTPILVLNDSAASNTALRLLSTGSATYIQSGISGGSFAPLIFTANGGGSEQMRLTSTGLGIGTSSPGQKLDVSGGNARINSGSSTTDLLLVDTGTTSGNVRLRSESNAMKFITGGGVSATLDSSGNLGLGVTPQAAAANNKWLEINGSTALSGYNAGGVYAYSLWGNAVAGKGINGGKASEFTWDSSSGSFVWRQTATSTAGAALSGTVSAMTLDASGNLGVGNTSPYTRIDISGNSAQTQALRISAGASAPVQIALSNGYSARQGVIYLGDGSSGHTSFGIISENTALTFKTAAYNIGPTSDLTTGWTERARIDSSGNLIQSAPTTPPSLATNGTMVFNLTSNTNLRVSVRGSDGVTRTANITLA